MNEVELEMAVREAIRQIRKRERDMAFVQGESPRPMDYSEGHYAGIRRGLREAAAAIESAL